MSRRAGEGFRGVLSKARDRPGRSTPYAREGTNSLVFIWKYVLQPDFQFVEDGFKIVEGEPVFAALDAMQCGVGQADPFGEVGIGQFTPLPSQEKR